MQRLRLGFSRGEEVKFISHLDLVRMWERALRRAQVPLAYSEGFSPHPRLSLAAPLPIGVTSEGELMDVWLTRWLSPGAFLTAVIRQLPAGIGVRANDLWMVGPATASLQSQTRLADYRVEIRSELGEPAISERIRSLMAAEKFPWHHLRDTGAHYYDLRVLINDLKLDGFRDGMCILKMRLRCDSHGSGRPEQVVAALGLSGHPEVIHRMRLILGDQ